MTYEQKKAEDEGRIPKTDNLPRTYTPLSKEELEKKSFGEKVKDFSKGVVDKAKAITVTNEVVLLKNTTNIYHKNSFDR